MKYTDKQLLDSLVAFSDVHGRAPKANECTPKVGLASANTYLRRFGSLNSAILEANLAINKGRNITKEQALHTLISYYEKYGTVPITRNCTTQLYDLYSPNTYASIFGSLIMRLRPQV